MQGIPIKGSQVSANRLNSVHNEFSKTGDELSTDERVVIFRASQRSRVQTPAARLYPLVMQALRSIEAGQTRENEGTGSGLDKPRLSGDGQYFYVNDSNGFAYLVDHGSMKIVHAARVVSGGAPKK